MSAVPTVNQQQRVNKVKLEKNQVADDLKNGQISDMSAMSEKVALDSKMSDARKPEVKYAEVVTTKPTDALDKTKAPEVTSPIANVDRQQKGKEMSEAEKQTVVDKQMNQMAINNKVLHGLA